MLSVEQEAKLRECLFELGVLESALDKVSSTGWELPQLLEKLMKAQVSYGNDAVTVALEKRYRGHLCSHPLSEKVWGEGLQLYRQSSKEFFEYVNMMLHRAGTDCYVREEY